METVTPNLSERFENIFMVRLFLVFIFAFGFNIDLSLADRSFFGANFLSRLFAWDLRTSINLWFAVPESTVDVEAIRSTI